ncbi:MAG TPA: ParB/RepB/Spo0J family partition protein [Turneriella sp.]|nr:ParB/RepB/Spo0J family partition protein [Turneriella sp.]HNA78004.1 ParB/RepB/Spo0J family partition protein [Turneriella sp.]HNJ65639.1 ParB/RepB/Spo0J family partition protein [Turneriella sp.]HNL09072.1 ParB/RepB/Spo0J family partition protein [Turneriella sp.]HNL53413.1 ParB/RepB/Spo0J family partition protein [Turneriella sp.]
MSKQQGKVLGRGLSNLLDSTVVAEAGERVQEIPVDKIRPNPENPRKKFERTAIEELAQTIKKHGLLQPILVQKKDDHYIVISGERRLRSLMHLGMAKAPCIVKELDRRKTLEVSLIENIQREQLDAIEEANVYKLLLADYSLTQEDLAEQVGKNRATIANRLRLLNLPIEVQAAIADGRLTEGQARPLLSIKNAELQTKLFREITDQGLNARAIEARARVLAAGKEEKKPLKGKKADANIKAVAQKVEEHTGMRTRINYNPQKKSGSITIDFFSPDDLEKLLKMMGMKRISL